MKHPKTYANLRSFIQPKRAIAAACIFSLLLVTIASSSMLTGSKPSSFLSYALPKNDGTGTGPTHPYPNPKTVFTKFTPQQNGFHFANDFVNNVVLSAYVGPLKIASYKTQTFGRCGGMAYAALDYYYNNIPIPSTRTLPKDGDPLADYIFQRLFDSYKVSTASKFADWSLRASQDTLLRDGVETLTKQEVPTLMHDLDSGNPVVLGLVGAKIGSIDELGNIGAQNHQVVAYGYYYDPSAQFLKVYIYDNNVPDQEVILSFYMNSGYISYSKDYPMHWRGFFIQDYSPKMPPKVDSGSGNGEGPGSNSPPPYLKISIEPNTIVASVPTSITVHASDSQSNAPVDGRILINNTVVGSTNNAFTYTFNANSPPQLFKGIVIPTFAFQQQEISFNVVLPKLNVIVQPDTVEIGKATTMIVNATDPITNEKVQTGKITTNEGNSSLPFPRQNQQYSQIGNIGTPFTHTFKLVSTLTVKGPRCPIYPTVVVVAEGYSATQVPIKFIGDLSNCGDRGDGPSPSPGDKPGDGTLPCLRKVCPNKNENQPSERVTIAAVDNKNSSTLAGNSGADNNGTNIPAHGSLKSDSSFSNSTPQTANGTDSSNNSVPSNNILEKEQLNGTTSSNMTS